MSRMTCVRVLFLYVVPLDLVIGKPTKLRVISDIHAGSCWQSKNSDELFNFLEQTAHDDVDALVLNGDIYDFWLNPLHRPSHTLEHILAHGVDPSLGFDMKRFQSALHKAAGAIHMVQEDVGNHDIWLTEDMAKQFLPNARLDSRGIRDFGISFEHGHSQSLFNQVPPNTSRMPIGYFVTRVVASYTCHSQERVSKDLTEAINFVLGSSVIGPAVVEILRSPSVFKGLLHRILETSAGGRANLTTLLATPVVGVVDSKTLPAPGINIKNYTLQHFVDDYADTLERFLDQVSLTEAAGLILGDMNSAALNTAIAEKSITDSMVVLGHTHVPAMKLVTRNISALSPTPDVLVVNAGAWVADMDGNSHASYLDITLDDVLESYTECWTEENGTDYRGTVHETIDGKPCIAWGAETILKSKYEAAFGKVAFCRNLGDVKAPWCYTGFESWGLCQVGPRQANCPKVFNSGAVRAELYRFPSKVPSMVAVRSATSASRWQVHNSTPSLHMGDLASQQHAALPSLIV